MKDYLTEYGHTGLIGSRDSTRLAFKTGIISDGDIWMEMIKARNLTSHSYDEALAEELHGWIIGKFYPAFAHLVEQLKELEAVLQTPSIRKEERTRLLTNLGAELQGMHLQRIHLTSRS